MSGENRNLSFSLALSPVASSKRMSPESISNKSHSLTSERPGIISFEKEHSPLMFSQKGKEDVADNIWEVREEETSSRIGEVLCTDKFKERAGLTNHGRHPSTMAFNGSCLLVFMPLCRYPLHALLTR